MTSANFSGFLTPLVSILDQSAVLKSCNLPYYIRIWATPSLPLSSDLICEWPLICHQYEPDNRVEDGSQQACTLERLLNLNLYCPIKQSPQRRHHLKLGGMLDQRACLVWLISSTSWTLACRCILPSFLSRVESRTLTLATRRWNRELYHRSRTMAHFSPIQVATRAGVVACLNFHGEFLSEGKMINK